MAFAHAHIEVGNEPTALTTAEGDNAPGQVGQNLLITNIGAEPVYLGGEDVSDTDYGYKLAVDATIPIGCASGEILYGVCDEEGLVSVLYEGVGA